MGPRELVGEQFGRWTVLARTEEKTADGRYYYNCRCACGASRKVDGHRLVRGHSTSCGCAGTEQRAARRRTAAQRHAQRQAEEIYKLKTRYGIMEVLGPAPRVNSTLKYRCRCVCGLEQDLSFKKLDRFLFWCPCGAKKRRVDYQNDPVSALKRYRGGAAARALEWKLSDEEAKALFDAPCAYCGVTPAETDRLNGIDRVDSLGNYTPDNVVAACTDCNLAKRTKPVDDFKAWLRRAARHLSACA